MATLSELRELFRTQSAKDTLDANSDPNVTLVDQYLNIAVREIARLDRPNEFMSLSGITANITAGTNYVAIPATIISLDRVLINDSSGSIHELERMNWTRFTDYFGIEKLYDITNISTPSAYSERNGKVMFNSYPNYSYTNGIRFLGVESPTTMSDVGHVTGLPSEYDLIITYTALSIFYQKENEDNGELLKRFIELRDMERAKLALMNEPSENESVTLDSRVWVSPTVGMRIVQNKYYTGL